MKRFAISLCLGGTLFATGCAPTSVEEVGRFTLNGQSFAITSTTPDYVSGDANPKPATYSVKVKGGTVYCDGTTDGCKAAAEQKINALESDEGAYG